jgi:hypothetical protein
MPSASEKVNAGIRADNYAVSAANRKAAQQLRTDHFGIRRAPFLKVAKIGARRKGVNDEDYNAAQFPVWVSSQQS